MHPPSEATTALDARLTIHASADPRKRGYLISTLHWLRGLYPEKSAAPDNPEVVLSLQIDNLQGQRVFSDDAAGPVVELDLPVGTYHVTAVHGTVCRGYTLTLEPGAAFDLYLCPSLGTGCRASRNLK